MTKDKALKQALEALYENTHYFMLGDPITYQDERNDDTITAIKEALAQPEQEPVQDSTCNETLRGQGKAYPRTCKKCGLGPCIGKTKFDDDLTQRKPLTGEQIEFAWMKVKHSTPGTALPIHEFARAIEAAHGIKENT